LIKIDAPVKRRNSIKFVIPAKAESSYFNPALGGMDPGFRRDDASNDFLCGYKKFFQKKS
jgi:hypothetical protein